MKKQISILSILIFIFGLVPINSSLAITQNQINAEVQIVCPDSNGNWYSGSGTIIDPKGIILTNKHVVTDEKNEIIKTCFVGFTESINKEPNFGTEGNQNLAEVKYYTNTDDMDSAILYLNNPTNKSYPYVNIWNSNSDSLKLGDGIEVIGYPSIGGSTLTYVNGVMSGYSGNYLKTTAPLEHGNSGGSAYTFDGKFIGIPTAVVKGELNSISFILDINKIKSWLSGFLGNDYAKSVDDYEPSITNKTVDLNSDLTPPDTTKVNASVCAEDKCLKYLNFENSWDVNRPYFNWNGFSDQSGIDGYYVYFGDNFNASPVSKGTYIKNNFSDPGFTLEKPGVYYLTIQAKDKKGNVSNPVYWTYYYKTSENIGKIEYKDTNTTKAIASRPTKFYIYSFDNGVKGKLLKEVFLDSSTVQGFEVPTNNIYVEWASTKNDFIFDEIAYFYNPKFYTTDSWISKCEWASNSEAIYNCFSRESKKEQYSQGNNYISMIGLKKGEKYVFDFSGYEKNKNSTWHFGVFKIKPTVSITFKKDKLLDKLKGKILLQVESKGEAWYINPKTEEKYYMANGIEAFKVMRNLGIGIKNVDLDKIKSNKTYAKKFSGKILLQIESRGEAYYIDFNGNAHYLKDGSAAYEVMRSLGLGITNSDLNKIPEGKF